jgi:hypothetical protein
MFATIELQKRAAADRYYHQLHPKPWAKSPEEAAWALMQRNHESWPMGWVEILVSVEFTTLDDGSVQILRIYPSISGQS